MIKAYKGVLPQISSSAYIADTAVIIGNVIIGDNVSIWENAVLRGDEGQIIIGKNSNVQDNCTIHDKTNIGCGVTIGHNAIVHGCNIMDDVIVGMGAVVLSNAEIGKNSIIGASALVSQGKKIPENSIVMGNPFIIKRESNEKDIEYIKGNALMYVELAKGYNQK